MIIRMSLYDHQILIPAYYNHSHKYVYNHIITNVHKGAVSPKESL